MVASRRRVAAARRPGALRRTAPAGPASAGSGGRLAALARRAGPDVFERARAAQQLAALVRVLGPVELGDALPWALPAVLAGAADASPAVQRQALWALHHLATRARRAPRLSRPQCHRRPALSVTGALWALFICPQGRVYGMYTLPFPNWMPPACRRGGARGPALAARAAGGRGAPRARRLRRGGLAGGRAGRVRAGCCAGRRAPGRSRGSRCFEVMGAVQRCLSGL